MQTYEEVEFGNLCLLSAHQKFLLGMMDAKHQHSPAHTLETLGPYTMTLQIPAMRPHVQDVSLKLYGGAFHGLVGGAIMQET